MGVMWPGQPKEPASLIEPNESRHARAGPGMEGFELSRMPPMPGVRKKATGRPPFLNLLIKLYYTIQQAAFERNQQVSGEKS
jgi:hypothetical protein